jgi:hypothetical protein
VTGALLERLLTTAAQRGGAVPGLPVGTPFLLRGDRVVRTDDLRRMQTPQAFHATGLLAAYRSATAAGFHGVDTAETVEHHGDLTVAVVAGDPDNRKVTFVDDLRPPRSGREPGRRRTAVSVSARPARRAVAGSSTRPSRPHPRGPARRHARAG